MRLGALARRHKLVCMQQAEGPGQASQIKAVRFAQSAANDSLSEADHPSVPYGLYAVAEPVSSRLIAYWWRPLTGELRLSYCYFYYWPATERVQSTRRPDAERDSLIGCSHRAGQLDRRAGGA